VFWGKPRKGNRKREERRKEGKEETGKESREGKTCFRGLRG